LYAIILSQMVFDKIKVIPISITFIILLIDTLGFKRVEGTTTLRELMCKCSDACPKANIRGEA